MTRALRAARPNRKWPRLVRRPNLLRLEDRTTPALFVVTSTADGGGDTLRDAIDLANATPGPDTISFNIAGTGPHQISLLSKLPDILESVIIDGSTQPGYVPNTLSKGSNAQPQIELTTTAGVTRGLNILADSVTIKGMIVTGFSGDAIQFGLGGTNGLVVGSFVGVRGDGVTAKANTQSGVVFVNGSNGVVGGPDNADRNVISGNSQQGIYAGPGTVGLLIRNNIIGLQAGGTAKAANGQNGIRVDGVTDVTITQNTVSGNTNNGIIVQTGTAAPGLNTTNVKITGNVIGLDVFGNIGLGNGNATSTHGINVAQVTSNSNVTNVTIGGPTAADRNVISGNAGAGVRFGVFTRNSLVQGNYIGTNLTGDIAIANSNRGIWINRANDITVNRNVVSGNLSDGILVDDRSYNNIITGNTVGLNAAGDKAMGNASGGIALNGSTFNNRVGGTTAADRNISSANRDGILVNGIASMQNVVQGNYVGTDVTGTVAIPNITNGGIRIDNAYGAKVGGSGAGEGNLIAGNAGFGGVLVQGQGAPGAFTVAQWTTGVGANNNFYVVSPAATTRDFARTAANKAGGNLVSINNADENAFLVANLVGASKLNITAWIGLNDVTTEGLYEWDDAPGFPAAYLNFGSAEPNNFGDAEDFSQIRADGTWNDTGNHDTARAVLEFTSLPDLNLLRELFYPVNLVQGNTIGLNSAGATLPNTGAGVAITGAVPRVLVGSDSDGVNDAAEANVIVNNGLAGVHVFENTTVLSQQWKVEQGGNGNYYFITPGTLTAPAAQALAASVGGYLTSITSAAENDFIYNTFLLGINAGGTVTGGTQNGIWIGLNDVATEGTFQWFSGEPVGYTNWNAGEPNNSGVDPGEDYVEMVIGTTPPGRWNDSNNTALRRAVIEFSAPPDYAAVAAALGFNSVVSGNFIGVLADGSTAKANGQGILLDTATGVTIRNNTISGNAGDGIVMTDRTQLVTVQGNRVGTNAAGLVAVPNGGNGVTIFGDSGFNRVGPNNDGKNEAAERNVIAGNGGNGIAVVPMNLPVVQFATGAGATNNFYVYASTGVSWTRARTIATGLGGDLVSIGSADENAFLVNNFTSAALARNGNFWIGLNDVAVEANTNGAAFVWSDGSTTAYRNFNTGEPNNSGNAPLGEDFAQFIVAAGTTIGKWNDVSYTVQAPSVMEFATLPNLTTLRRFFETGGIVIEGALIGVGADGTTAIGNGAAGISVGASTGVTIGRQTPTELQVNIRNNAGAGVVVNGPANAVRVRGVSVSGNGGLGIDLGGDGVTANDPLDADSGPNGLANYPVLTSVTAGPSTTVGGTYSGLPNATVAIDFYANAAADASGFGEGLRYLGSTTVATDAGGLAAFSASSLGATTVGEFIVATATVPDGSTSEFSANLSTLATPAAKVTGVEINGGATQRSRVTSLKVSFDQVVSFANIANAFTLTRVSDSASVTLNPVLDGSGTFVTITFTGGAVDGANPLRSLADGRYTLTAVAGEFGGAGLDGDGNGSGGDNYVLNSTPFVNVGSPATGIFRLFGDANGNGQVGTDDFLAFRLAFLSNTDAFDNDGNATVDAGDFLKFRLNFLATIV